MSATHDRELVTADLTTGGAQVARATDGVTLPVVIRSAVRGADASGWIDAHRPDLAGLLLSRGAVLLRDFGIDSAAAFQRAVEALEPGPWVDYREPATPRSHVAGHVFTSTEYDASSRIYLHNENSHCTSWPMRLYFCCLEPASDGGATPLADCRRVVERIDPSVRDAFVERGWMIVRNFGPTLGFSWERVFGVTSRAELERYCEENDMTPEWRSGGRLTVRYRRPALRRHPLTGERVWFNHGTFFHPSTMDPELRELFLEEFEVEDFPFSTRYGDGSEIPAATFDLLRDAYDAETVRFAWQPGDFLAIDNMLVAHGRDPYAGERRVLVAMTDPVAPADLGR